MDGGKVGGFGLFLAFFGQKKVMGSNPGGRGFGGQGQGQGRGQGPGQGLRQEHGAGAGAGWV